MPLTPPPARSRFGAPAAPGAAVPGPGRFRARAAFALPRMRPVADFVALPSTRRYVTVAGKFAIAVGAAAAWLVVAFLAALLVLPSVTAGTPAGLGAVLFVVVVAVPGVLVTFAWVGVLLDQPPTPAAAHPTLPVTVAVVARNQPRSVVASLQALRAQDYDGSLQVLLVDHGSTDATVAEAHRAAVELGLALRVVAERRPGAADARNAAAACADTPLLVLVDAGTQLHPSAVRLLVARLLRSPSDTAAVAAHALARNTRSGDRAELVAWEYSLDVHASQRLHGLFQAPLVAEDACTLYRTDALRAVGGWARDDGDGVILVWRFLERGWRVFHESLALAFTEEPVTVGSWASRRVRAAAAVLEGARANGIGALRFPFNRAVALLDAVAPVTDGVFAGGGLVALALAAAGAPGLLVAYGLLVVPVSLAAALSARTATRRVLDDVGLDAPRGPATWPGLVYGLHAVQAPMGAWHALGRVFRRVA